MRGWVLGLDGGGTQTRAEVAAVNEIVTGRGRAGACNLAAVSLEEALAAAREAATESLREASGAAADVRAVCAGVAGASFEIRRIGFLAGLQEMFPNAQVHVLPDYAIALTGATAGQAGAIVIAGTGSASYGENAAGESHRTGAYGYLIDDAGSGYGVGRAALAAVLRAADGTGEATSLTERLPAALGLASLRDIVPGVYGDGISRVAIAALSRTVADAARDDADAAAQAILMRAGGALAHLAHGITRRLFAGGEQPFPLCPIGGLWNAGNMLTDVFTRSLRRFAPAAIFSPPLHSPVEGAVMRARQTMTSRTSSF